MTRKKRILIGLPVIAALLAGGFFYYPDAFSGFRVKRELNGFADALETCTPLAQDYWVPLLRQTMFRGVEGEGPGGCVVKFATLGAGALRCEILPENLPAIAANFRKRAEATPYFSLSQSLIISTGDGTPDPLMALYNSPNCQLEP